MTFVNDHPKRSVYLFWQGDGKGEGQFMAEIKPKTRTSMKTYPGHVWVFRAGQDIGSKKLKRFVVSDNRQQESWEGPGVSPVGPW